MDKPSGLVIAILHFSLIHCVEANLLAESDVGSLRGQEADIAQTSSALSLTTRSWSSPHPTTAALSR